MQKTNQFAKGVIFTAALGMLTAFTVRIPGSLVSTVQPQPPHPLARTTALVQETSAAFRDGLYVGKIASERGSEPRISVGRWALPEDRAAYASGYLRGYNQHAVHVTATSDDD